VADCSVSKPQPLATVLAPLHSHVVTFGPPNGTHAKLCGQGPRADGEAARRLPRMTFKEPNRELQPP
jgi:hypothetical protein